MLEIGATSVVDKTVGDEKFTHHARRHDIRSRFCKLCQCADRAFSHVAYGAFGRALFMGGLKIQLFRAYIRGWGGKGPLMRNVIGVLCQVLTVVVFYNF